MPRTFRHHGGRWRDTATGRVASWATVKRSRAARRGARKAAFYHELAQALAEETGYVYIENVKGEEGTQHLDRATVISGLQHSWLEIATALHSVENHPGLASIRLMHISAFYQSQEGPEYWHLLSHAFSGKVAVSQARFQALRWMQRYKNATVLRLALMEYGIGSPAMTRPITKETRKRDRRKYKPRKGHRGRGPK